MKITSSVASVTESSRSGKVGLKVICKLIQNDENLCLGSCRIRHCIGMFPNFITVNRFQRFSFKTFFSWLTKPGLILPAQVMKFARTFADMRVLVNV